MSALLGFLTSVGQSCFKLYGFSVCIFFFLTSRKIIREAGEETTVYSCHDTNENRDLGVSWTTNFSLWFQTQCSRSRPP